VELSREVYVRQNIASIRYVQHPPHNWTPAPPPMRLAVLLMQASELGVIALDSWNGGPHRRSASISQEDLVLLLQSGIAIGSYSLRPRRHTEFYILAYQHFQHVILLPPSWPEVLR
jgi:hypothetical protein